MKTKTISVRVTMTIPVEIPDGLEGYDEIFDIEDNHCAGTGLVGIAISQIIKECDSKGFCWGCAVDSRCEIIEEINEPRP